MLLLKVKFAWILLVCIAYKAGQCWHFCLSVNTLYRALCSIGSPADIKHMSGDQESVERLDLRCLCIFRRICAAMSLVDVFLKIFKCVGTCVYAHGSVPARFEKMSEHVP